MEKSRQSADAANMDEMVKAVEVYAADGINTPIEGDAVITISSNGTSVAAKGTAKAAVGTEASTTKTTVNMVESALNEHVKDYKNIKMKSSNWKGDISAEIHVDSNGAVTVVYKPENTFGEYMGQKKVS